MSGGREVDAEATLPAAQCRHKGRRRAVLGTLVPGTRQDQVPSAVLPGSTKTVPGATRYRPGSSGSTTSLV